MRKVLGLCCGLSLALACAVAHPRVQRDLDVPEAPPLAFARAMNATMAIQATIHAYDPTLRMISATVGNHVKLNVVIRPSGTGSHIEVAHEGARDVLYLQPITWVDTWLAAYQQQP